MGLLLALGACTRQPAPSPQPTVPADADRVAQEFMRAVRTADSVTLRRISSGDRPFQWAVGARVHSPQVVAASGEGMQIKVQVQLPDGALLVEYEVPFRYVGGTCRGDANERLQFNLRQLDAQWKVEKALVVPC